MARAPDSTLVDRVKIYAISSGTGPFTLGAPVRSYRGVETLIDGDTYSYAAENGGQFEVGRGQYQASQNRLTRQPVASSNAGGLVDFLTDTQIAFTALASDLSVVSAYVDAVLAVGFETWEELLAFAPNLRTGDRTFVSSNDTGTHVDPTFDGQVPNAGVYEKFEGEDQPIWIYATLENQAAQAAQAALAAIPGVMQPYVDEAQTIVDGIPATVQPYVDDTQAAAGFLTRAALLAFSTAGKLSTGEQSSVGTADTGTHTAVAGEIALGGGPATVGAQIPNTGRYVKQASGAVWRVDDLDSQRTALVAAAAQARVTVLTRLATGFLTYAELLAFLPQMLDGDPPTTVASSDTGVHGGIPNSGVYQRQAGSLVRLANLDSDTGRIATGFTSLAALTTFAPKLATGETTTVSYLDAGTHAAVAGEIALGGLAATVGAQIPNEGWYAKQASGAVWRSADTSRQRTVLQAERAEAAALAASSKASNDAIEPGRRPIEAIPGIYAIYGMRRMLMTYSGPLLRLRKTVSGVSTEQDFGPANGSDLLDVATITTWLEGAVGYVRSLYDQSGKKRHWDQPTLNSQPTLMISGANAWIVAAPSRRLFGTSALLDFARYQDGNTAAMLLRVAVAPTAFRNILQWSRGNGGGTARFSLGLMANVPTLSLNVRQYDDAGSGGNNQPYTLNTWFRGIGRADYRGSWSEDFVNGVSTGPGSTGVSGKSEDTASTGASINGSTTTDLGTDFDYSAIVLFQRTLTNAEIKTLDGIMATFAPDYVAPARPSTIMLFGDEQFLNAGIADPVQRIGAQLGNLYETQDGTYRLARMYGVAGNTTAQVETRVIATPFTTTDVIVVQAGQNDGISASTANHAAALQNLQDIAAAVPSGRYLISTVPFLRSETTGTTANTNKAAFNSQIMSLFGSKAVDIATILATSGGNTDGATPLALLISAGSILRNAAGVAVEVAAYKTAIAGQGW